MEVIHERGSMVPHSSGAVELGGNGTESNLGRQQQRQLDKQHGAHIGSIATTKAIDLIIGLMNPASYVDNNVNVPLISSWPSAGFNYLQLDGLDSVAQVLPVYQITSTPGTYHSTGTETQSFGWQGSIFALSPGGCGP